MYPAKDTAFPFVPAVLWALTGPRLMVSGSNPSDVTSGP